MAVKLYLMRHGQTLFNSQKRVQGWCDSPLTEKGKEQALSAKTYFEEAGVTFDFAYASTQERARDTLELITDTPFEQVKGLKEMSFGVFEAREEELLPKHRPGSQSFEDLLVPYGGEDIRQVGDRVEACLEALLENHNGQTLLAVSHGAAMWGFILQQGMVLPDGFTFGNCAICQIHWDKDGFVLEKVINPLTKEVFDC